MPTAIAVRPGRHDEVDVLSRILAQAFHPLPSARWLIDDDVLRGRCFPAYFAIFVEHALTVGHVDVVTSGRSDQPVGVALWWHGNDPGEPDDYDTRLADVVPAEQLDRFVRLDALMHDAHPDQQAGFDYLAFIAVQPAAQRHGIGTDLLRHRHAELDRAGVSSYLVAATPDSRELYTRHGYQPIGDPITLPAHGPQLWPMWWEPGHNRLAPLRTSEVVKARTPSAHDD